MRKGLASVTIIGAIILLIALVLGSIFLYQTRQKSSEPVACTMDSKVCPDGTVVGRVPPTCEFAPCPDEEDEEIEIEAEQESGWQTYTSIEYGFEISYPASYQALDDAENLYGWPDAIVLFYKGGQAYDISIEIWDSQAQYQEKYPDASSLSVYQINGKYLTISDNTNDVENLDVINTFKLLQ